MNSLSNWLRLCCFLKVIGEFNGYVLLAADSDDFRNIARKIVPEHLANKLALLASDMSAKQTSRGKKEEPKYYYESEVEDDFYEDEGEESATEIEASDVDKSDETMYVKEWQTRVNFDELVERVKDRLAKELSDKLKNHITNPSKGTQSHSIYNNMDKEYISENQIKVSTNNDTRFGSKQDINKTYGYNNSNKGNNFKFHRNTPNYFNADFPRLKKNTYLVQKPKHIPKPYNNNDSMYDELKKNDMELSNTYEVPLLTYATDKTVEKYTKEKNHEEDNNLYHSKNNKDIVYETDEILVKNTKHTQGNKKYVKNDNSPDYPEQNENGFRFQENEPRNYIYEDNMSPRLDTDQPTFTVKDSKQPLYNEFDLTSKRRNDSYEDYIIPKVENIFASEETNKPINKDTPRKIKKSVLHNYDKARQEVQRIVYLKKVKPYNNERQYSHTDDYINHTEDYKERPDESIEIKAKTESMLYNYDDSEPKTIKSDRTKDWKIISKISSTKRLKPTGTMIPTREHFKMASPNYYISLPTVVEKYDSNEPLPEKDREREVIKHFVNPPASINKKVKLI